MIKEFYFYVWNRRTVKDKMTMKEVVLSDEELAIIEQNTELTISCDRLWPLWGTLNIVIYMG